MVSFALQTLQKTKLYTLPPVFTVQVQRRHESSTPQPILPLPNVSNFGGCITAPGPFLETSFFLHALIPLMISPSPKLLTCCPNSGAQISISSLDTLLTSRCPCVAMPPQQLTCELSRHLSVIIKLNHLPPNTCLTHSLQNLIWDSHSSGA